MWLYRLLDRVFPKSLTAKVFLLAFVGTHVPLVAAILFALLAAPSIAEMRPVIMVLFIATLVGAAGTLFGLRALLTPIRLASAAAAAYEARRQVPNLPRRYRDEAGRLLDVVQRLTERADTILRATEAAADHDPLTGLLNRRGFEKTVARQRTAGLRGALLIIDLDHFKRINDRFGHATGDDVLIAVASAIRGAIRKIDCVGRFGGEEILVFLSGATEEGSRIRAESLRRTIAETDHREAGTVTASIGVAVTDTGRESFDVLFRAADAALYEAKRAGRNRVVFAGDPAPAP